ncbi:MAG: hypothetical protein ACOZJX_03955 [Pseudomonadota bacterium]
MLLYAAAALMALTGLAHSVLGERYILTRLFRRDNLPELFGGTAFTTGTLRFVWHLLSVVWWGIAALVVLAAQQALDARTVLQVFSAVAAISASLPLYFTGGRHLSWVVFLVIAALLWAAAPAT